MFHDLTDCITVIFRDKQWLLNLALPPSGLCSIALAYNMIGIQDSIYIEWGGGGTPQAEEGSQLIT